MEQTLNLRGFIAGIDIEPDEFMLPILEVIVNAIQSIEDIANLLRWLFALISRKSLVT